jgi:FixJ family two-component response regulator
MQSQLVISIVDDDESVRVATASLLRSLDCSVRLFESGEQFLRCSDFDHVNCIVSDIQMPGMSGIEMYYKLLARGVSLPIIFISGFVTDAVRQATEDAGAICTLSKPIDVDSVARCLDLIKDRVVRQSSLY